MTDSQPPLDRPIDYARRTLPPPRPVHPVVCFMIAWGAAVTLRHGLYWLPRIADYLPEVTSFRFLGALVEVAGFAIFAIGAWRWRRGGRATLCLAGCIIVLPGVLWAAGWSGLSEANRNGTEIWRRPLKQNLQSAWVIVSTLQFAIVPAVALWLLRRETRPLTP